MIDFKGKKVLAIVAHPDDELLGLGATIHQLVHTQQVEARAVILGEGITSRADQRDPERWKAELNTHRQNIHAAQEQVGYASVGIYDFPDNRFDTVSLLDLVKVIETEKQSFQPDIIFTHHAGDLNIDHRRTFEAVLTATRPMAGEPVKTILTFETPSSTEWVFGQAHHRFMPNVFVPISETALAAKIAGMECYEYERRVFPHPRSPEALRALAQQRGITVGSPFAEAFCLVRSVIVENTPKDV